MGAKCDASRVTRRDSSRPPGETERAERVSRCPFAKLAMATILLGMALSPAAAQVAPAEAEEFVGSWTLSMIFNGREIEMSLDLLEIDGVLGGTLSSVFRSEPQQITDIAKEGGILTLAWMTTVQGQDTTLQLALRSVDGELAGTFGDIDGFFSTEITGWQGDRPPPPDGQAASARGSRRGDSSTELIVADQKITIRYAPLKAGSPDYERLLALASGEVSRFEGGRAIKLLSEASLKFGDTVVPKGNVAANYGGVYSLWLKKTDDGWELVFNREGDIWGTQRLAAADVTSVRVDYGRAETEAEELTIELVDAPGGGLLRLAWGASEWMAPFEVTD